MDPLSVSLAVAGLALLVWSRIKISREGRTLGETARLVVRFIPFSEIICFAGDWAKVSTAAFLSLIGWVLVLPWATQFFLGDAMRSASIFAPAPAAGFSLAGRKPSIDSEGRESFRIAKVEVLRERVAGWHEDVEIQREALQTEDAMGVAEFNAEAADYHAFLEVVREEAAALRPVLEAAPEPVPVAIQMPAPQPVPQVVPRPPAVVATPRPEPTFKPLGTPKPLPVLKEI